MRQDTRCRSKPGTGPEQRTATKLVLCSVLLMAVRIVNELPVQLLRLLGVELLAAVRALKLARNTDADLLHGSIARLGCLGDFNCFWHSSVKQKNSRACKQL